VAVVSDARVVKKIGPGAYRVESNGRGRIVYVAGPPSNRWAFCDGEVYRAEPPVQARRAGARGHVAQSLTAPMPATVLKVLVAPGAEVRKGDTVVVLEAMKMELPVRAPADATVMAVNCREGEIVQPDTVLVELE
jgi:3-methylcrotonyl-CoA carboxylase alpha subunit